MHPLPRQGRFPQFFLPAAARTPSGLPEILLQPRTGFKQKALFPLHAFRDEEKNSAKISWGFLNFDKKYKKNRFPPFSSGK